MAEKEVGLNNEWYPSRRLVQKSIERTKQHLEDIAAGRTNAAREGIPQDKFCFGSAYTVSEAQRYIRMLEVEGVTRGEK